MPTIHFKTSLFEPGADAQVLVTLPMAASAKLTSRSTSLVNGEVNGVRFWVALEPDGNGTHWFTIDKAMMKAAKLSAGDTADFAIDPIPVKEWPEPKVPVDLKKAINADPHIHELWASLTPMSRWDWVRWTDTVKLAETRRERPEKLCSMLKAGKRRPCCFNRAARTPAKSAELM